MMNNKYKFTVLIVFCLLPSAYLHTQEVLMDLTINPVIAKKYHEIKNSPLKINPVKLDTIDISVKGFLDDFSKENIYPDSSLWLDSNVFINRDYPIAPPTLGVATFDGVSKSGCPYDTLASSTLSAGADTLTSKPINLSPPSFTNIYLSFYWQAMGKGNRPEPADSLVLEFFSPSLNQWNHIWARGGYTAVSPPDSIFRLAIFPITDPAYLQNGFKFRFRNYATVSGNVDHWHIDYVYLDKNRTAGDTIFDDVAFVYNSHSLLKNYYAMPWEQYNTSEMKTNLDFFIRNNDNNALGKNIAFDYTIYDKTGGTEASYTGGSINIYPYATSGYHNYAQHTNPCIGDNTPPPLPCTPYAYPAITKDTSFLLECIINTTPDKDRWNDTLRFKQTFNNYYAYDDGTVEAGYGLSCQSPPCPNAQLAYKFTLNQTDVLYAVYMLFNWIPQGVNQQQFKIRIWSDSSGFPGPVIYEDIATTPNYQYVYHNWANTNMFYPYILQTPQTLSGTFHVGFIQYTNPPSLLLNLGLDKNTDSRTKMYYNMGSGWVPSALTIPCSWMMRPVFGDIDGLLNVHDETPSTSSFSIYPNPSNGQFTVYSLQSTVQIQVYNTYGQLVFQTTVNSKQETVNLSEAKDGVYFIRVTDETGITHSQKLILAK